jgi:hypothetical protein
MRRPAKKQLFLAELSKRGIVLRACEAAGIGRRVAYEWREQDPQFALDWKEAEEVATDLMEEEAVRRGVKGVRRDIYYKGEVVGHEREYSDSLIQFMLKANRKEKFKERVDVNHEGKVGVEVMRIYLPSNGREVITVHGNVVKDDEKSLLP